MIKSPEEWLKQANYDMGAAKGMFDTRRYIYTVFMCHLSIEKALKGLYAKQFEKDPPKTHDLIYLAGKIALTPPETLHEFLKTLNEKSVPTRYPDVLQRMQRDYNKKKTAEVLKTGKELLKWIKEQY